MRSRSTPWRLTQTATIFMLAPFNMLAALGMDMYLPVVPGMADVLRVDAATIQLTLSMYLVILGAGQLLFGPLSDRCGRRPVLLAGALSFTIASCALALTSSPASFFVWRFVQACGAAATMVAVFATVRDLYGGTGIGHPPIAVESVGVQTGLPNGGCLSPYAADLRRYWTPTDFR